MIVVGFRDTFEEEMLDVLLNDWEAFCLLSIEHLGCCFISGLVRSAHIIGTFEVAHLL